jgi:transcription elongation factor Elf1
MEKIIIKTPERVQKENACPFCSNFKNNNIFYPPFMHFVFYTCSKCGAEWMIDIPKIK